MIPLPTRKVTFHRAAGGGDPYEDAVVSTVASGVRAHIGAPSGNETQVGGSQERVDAVLLCDLVSGVDHYCTVTDDATGEAWEVVWVRPRRGLGLDHLQAGVQAVAGASDG